MDVDYNINSEMKKLQYFGAGKKVALPSIKQGTSAGNYFIFLVKINDTILMNDATETSLN